MRSLQKWDLLTVEYSKSFRKDGKSLLARNKKHLQIKKQNGALLFVWVDKKDGLKKGSKDIDTALKNMTSKRDPIKSEMWEKEENQSLYQAADYNDD
jgi:hypothetical protein